MDIYFLQVEYKKDLENTKGHSINFCETPQFKNSAKIAQFTSDVSLKRDINKDPHLYLSAFSPWRLIINNTYVTLLYTPLAIAIAHNEQLAAVDIFKIRHS